MDTISLGIENTTLQPQIQSLEEEIQGIEADSIIADDVGQTTYSKFVGLRKQEHKKKHEIDQFLSQTASEIKNTHPDWSRANFNKNTFLSEIENANLLSEEQYKLNIERVRESLTSPTHLFIPTINLQQLYERVNTALSKEIMRKVKVSIESEALLNWVMNGLKLHADRETCAFCAAQLSDERIEQLMNCFDDELDVLNGEISGLMKLIDGLKEQVTKVPTISSHEYNLEFRQEVQDLNQKLSSQKALVMEFLTVLTKNLSIRKTSIFDTVPISITSVPGDFSDIKNRYEKLLGKQESYGEELQGTREKAKQSLIANEVAKQILKVDYQKLVNEREYLTSERMRAEAAVENRKACLSTKRRQLSELRPKTVNVDSAAEKINDYLKLLGNQAFILSHAGVPGTEGPYRILSYDGTVRDIETLSTGEKILWPFYGLL